MNGPPRDTWDDFKARFRTYRLCPSPGGMSRRPLFVKSGRRLCAAYLRRYSKFAGAAVNRVADSVDTLRRAKLLPDRPSTLRQSDIGRIVRAVVGRQIRPAPALRGFWEALILYRDEFRCVYCGRTPDDVYRETKETRGLGLVVDHRVPLENRTKKKIMAEFKDLDLANCVCACWVCNTIKAAWPETVFREEARSFARAILARS